MDSSDLHVVFDVMEAIVDKECISWKNYHFAQLLTRKTLVRSQPWQSHFGGEVLEALVLRNFAY